MLRRSVSAVADENPPNGCLLSRVGRLVGALLVLFFSSAAHADDAGWTTVVAGRAQFDGVANDCWTEAPMDASVACVDGRPEHAAAYSLSVGLTNNTGTTTDIVIGFQSSDLTATAGSDYVAVNRTLTLAWDAATAAVDVAFVDDTVVEGHETFMVEVSAPTDVDVSWTHAHFTVLDEESIRMTAMDYVADESDGEVWVEVELSEGVTWPVEIHIESEDGTATSPDDYPAVDRLMEIAYDPEEDHELIAFRSNFAIVDDDIDEAHEETFSFVVTGIKHLALEELRAEMTIIDDDEAPERIVLTANPAVVTEDGGAVDVEVTASFDKGERATPTEVTVSVTGSGVAGAVDFEPVSDFVLTIPARAANGTGTFTLTPLDDGVDEADETLTIAGTADLPVEDAEVVLEDDDAGPGISIGDVSALEHVGTMMFPVELDAPSERQVTVAYRTMDGHFEMDADASADYVETSGTLTFAPGEQRATIEVAIIDDENPEWNDLNDEIEEFSGNERFIVHLERPLNATLVDATAVGSIESDDPFLRAGFFVSFGEVARDITIEFEVFHMRKPRDPVVVSYYTEDGPASFTLGDHAFSGAVAPDDYLAVSGTLTFAYDPARTHVQRQVGVPITLIDDIVPELPELFFVKASSPGLLGYDRTSDAFGDVAVGFVLVSDYDREPDAIRLTADPTVAREDGGPVDVEVTAEFDDGGLGTPTEVAVSVTGSGVAEAVDFEPVPDFVLTIPAGSASGTGTFTLTPEDDRVDETDETLTVAGISDFPVEGDEVVLEDDDVAATQVTLSLHPPLVREEAGAVDVEVTAVLDGAARPRATTVAVAVSGSGRAGTVGFAAVEGFELVIGAGETQAAGTFALTPEDDDVDEADETVSVEGTSDLPVTGAELELVDDDETSAEIALTAKPPLVGEGGGAVSVEVTATLDAAARTTATTVRVTATGSGAADAVDFAPVEDFEIVIAAEEASGAGTFTLTPVDDAVDETDETLTLAGEADLPVTGTSVELTDDDQTSTAVVLTARPDRVEEDDGTVEVGVEAVLDGGARTVATRVSVSVSASGAAGVVGFAAVEDFEIEIAAEASSGTGTFTLTPTDDDVDQADETVSVEGTSELSVRGATVDLVDDDPSSRRVLLTALPDFVSEGDGAVEVAVTAELDRSARREAMVVAVTVAGSGDPGRVDFAAVPEFTVTIAAGSTTGRGAFTLTPEADDTVEMDEELTVSGTSELPVVSATVVLGDDDQASTRVLLTATPGRVVEDAGPTEVAVTARLNADARDAATVVTVTVSGSGAAEAVDFGPVPSFAITIGANELSGGGTFTLTPEDDDLVETEETLTLTGTSDLEVSPAEVALGDDDEASTGVLLTARPARVSEGDGGTMVVVTASLDRDRRRVPTVVTVTVSGSGAPEAVDFAPVPEFVIEIPADAASSTGTFTLTPRDDEVDEADETLTVSGASDLPVSAATVVLADDDEAPTRIVLTAAPTRVSEGAGAVPVEVTASLDRGQRERATAVTVTVTGGDDPEAVESAPVPEFLVRIPAHASSGVGTFTVEPRDDREVEADGALTLSASADLPAGTAAVVLADDDEVSTRILLFLRLDPVQASEGGGPVRVTVTAAVDRGVRPEDTRIAAVVSGSGDPDAVDFESVPDFEIVIPAESPSGTASFTVVPEDDRTAETDETVTVSGASDLPVTPATMRLLDDDEEGVVALTVAPGRVPEDGGPAAVTVTATLTGALRQADTAVTVSVSGSGNPDAVDFESVSDFRIVIPAGAASASGTFTLTPEDDAQDEPDETVSVTGRSDLEVRSATLVLPDDDAAPVAVTATVRDAAAPEGAGGLSFAVVLDRAAADEVTVGYATTDGTAAAGSDYVAVSGTLTFAPGDVSATVRVPLLDDAEDEPDETFALTLTDPENAVLGRASAQGTIRDDDVPALSVADAAAPEGAGGLSFAVVLDRAAADEVTVGYATTDGTAAAGSDYVAVSGTLTFAPGDVSATVRVPLLDDAEDEPDETFALTLTDPENAVLGRASAQGTIRDDDVPALSVADAAGSEGTGELAFAVTLSGAARVAVTAAYATADGTATAGTDYTATSGTLTLAPGETSATLGVAILDDALDEADEETFALVLSSATGAALAVDTATGTVADDDAPPQYSVTDAAGDESVGELAFTVMLDGPSGREVTLAYATADGTATAGTDYTATSGTLTLAPGETSATLRVAILDDALDEAPEETFTLVLSNPVHAVPADAEGTGTIRDDDLAPPSVSGELPAALLCVGGAPLEVDLTMRFAGESLHFSVVSSSPEVATAALTGARLTVSPVAEGRGAVTVTAANDAGSVEAAMSVTVVTDPAEIEALESALASVGRGVLAGAVESVADRFAEGIPGERTVSPGADAVDWGMLRAGDTAKPTVASAPGGRPGEWTERLFDAGAPRPALSAGGRGMRPFAFELALDGSPSGGSAGSWSVWARGGERRFSSGADGGSHDGTLTGIHLGADFRTGNWLAGLAVQRSAAEADYRFERSAGTCGGGQGEGLLEVDLTSVQPYVGRRVGRGWLWATLGAGDGEVTAERCESGHVNGAGVSVRLAALGGRHPFAVGERVAVSVVEDIGVLGLTTDGSDPGPLADRDVTVGRTRLGLEAAGVPPADCDCHLEAYVRAFARGDWGDGASGAGLELEAGVRWRSPPRRLGVDLGVRALAAHSADDVREHGADATLTVLPRADGTGWRAALGWRRSSRSAGPEGRGIVPWDVPSAFPTDRDRWTVETRLGYGFASWRGFAVPFVEFDADGPQRGARLGVVHEFGAEPRRLVLEWGVGRHGLVVAGPGVYLEALGRF